MSPLMVPLSTHERNALRLAAQGYTDAVACRHHNTCERTYRRHLGSATDKLGARNRIHAVAIAAALGIIAVAGLEGSP